MGIAAGGAGGDPISGRVAMSSYRASWSEGQPHVGVRCSPASPNPQERRGGGEGVSKGQVLDTSNVQAENGKETSGRTQDAGPGPLVFGASAE